MKVIRDAMLSCFPKSSDLEMFLKYELNKQLSAIATESTMPKMIFDVIVYADRYGWLSELVRAMRTKFEGNDKVAAAADIGL